MKLKFTLTASLLGLGLAAGVCGQTPAKPADAPVAIPPVAAPSYTEDQVLEAFGWYLGKTNGLSELEFTKEQTDALVKGLILARDGKEAPTDLQKIGPEIEKLLRGKQEKYMARMKQEGAAQAEKYFAEIKTKPGVVALPSGVYYEILTPGTGPYPKAEDTVKIHYTGMLTNGTVFDTSLKPRMPNAPVEPAQFPLAETVSGFKEGLQKINKGGKIKLHIPAQLGYGDEQKPGIPPLSLIHI